MSTEGGGLKGKGFDRLQDQRKEEEKKFSGELKGKGLHEEESESESSLEIGTILINRDTAISSPDSAEYVIETVDGEPGKRHFVLKNRKTNATIGKGEDSLKDAIERGVWRRKE